MYEIIIYRNLLKEMINAFVMTSFKYYYDIFACDSTI